MRAYGLVVVCLAGVVGACGGKLADYDGDAGPDSGAHDGGPIFLDGGPVLFDGGPIPVDAGPPPPPPIGAYGFVVAQEDGQNGGLANLSAGFSKNLSRVCALAQPTGTCEIGSCPSADRIGGLSAGTITVSGGTQPASIAPSPGPGGVVYQPFQANAQIWPVGAPLTVVGTGGDVPAFQATFSVTTPVSLDSPQQGAAIDSSSDLVVRWSSSPGSSSEVFFYLLDPSSNQNPTFLACTFSRAASQATVPSSLLRQLKGTVSSGNVVAALWPLDRTAVYRAPFIIEASTLGTGTYVELPLR